jgi:protein-L-isoaspartate O-methyltransferase
MFKFKWLAASQRDIGRIVFIILSAFHLFACSDVTTTHATTRTASSTDSDKSQTSLYKKSKPSADGIGKIYMGREIAGVMGWQGASWLEREERGREERPDLLLPELNLKAGMTVADIGAGTGYYSRLMAKVVGATGMVYAVDVQPQMVAMLKEVAAKTEFANIKPVLSNVNDVKLPPQSIDLAIMVDVYHELEFPHEVMTTIINSLKPEGRVVFVEYRAEDQRVPIKEVHKMTEAQVKREALTHALTWERTAATLPWQHVIIFRKK